MVKVLKFGGTSVGSAESIKEVAKIIQSEKATIVVLSAMSGTTDALLSIVSLTKEGGDSAAIDSEIEKLNHKYKGCVKELLATSQREALKEVETTVATIYKEIDNYQGDFTERRVVAQGELLTTKIFTLYLKELGEDVELLNAPALLQKKIEGHIDNQKLRKSLQTLKVGESRIYVTQGFICSDCDGNLDNLERGGSDYSAALIAAAIGADQVQVWTDIDGMHNNDPRYVENTYPLTQLSFDEAAELAYFGAKILHPTAIQPCKEMDIPVLLKNTMDPKAKGTVISKDEEIGRKYTAVAAKDGITAIRIHSTRMLMAYGFLRRVFEVFEKYKTPIDMITTSEVSVSLTIDNNRNLEKIVSELEEFGRIEVEYDNSIACLVGNLRHHQNGVAAEIMGAVKDVPLKMISYGASNHSITLLVDTANKREILQDLNDKLFT